MLETVLPDEKFATGTTLELKDPSWLSARILEVGSNSN
jgi:hypothetical protein